MGNNSAPCQPTGTIDTNNKCTYYDLDQAGSNIYQIPNACAFNQYGNITLGPNIPIQTSLQIRRDACTALSNANEWIFNEGDLWACQIGGSKCLYAAYDGQAVNGNCNVGGGLTCQRVAYEGDPLPCCLLDDKFRNVTKLVDSNTCFSDKAHQLTCPINNRDIISDQSGITRNNNNKLEFGDCVLSYKKSNASTSGNCRQLVYDYCTGQDVTDSSWFKRWDGEESPCVHAVKRNLFTVNDALNNIITGAGYNIPLLTPNQNYDSSMFINSSGFSWSRDVIDIIMNRYKSDGFALGTLPGYTGYNDFQNVLYSICQNVPGLCETQLTSMCSTETTARLLNNPVKVQWCGCYMPTSEYSTYANNFAINRECTPICNRQGNIFQPNPSGIGRVTCQQGICVIDDVNLTLASTNVSGQISVNQICGGCGGKSSCQCYILNTNITAVNSTIGGDIDISQACSATNCYRTSDQNANNQGTDYTTTSSRGAIDPNTSTTANVSCDAPIDYNPVDQNQADQQQQQQKDSRNQKLYIIIGIVIVFILVLFILLLAGQGHKPDQVIPRHHVTTTSDNNVGSQSISSAPSNMSYATPTYTSSGDIGGGSIWSR